MSIIWEWVITIISVFIICFSFYLFSLGVFKILSRNAGLVLQKRFILIISIFLNFFFNKYLVLGILFDVLPRGEDPLSLIYNFDLIIAIFMFFIGLILLIKLSRFGPGSTYRKFTSILISLAVLFSISYLSYLLLLAVSFTIWFLFAVLGLVELKV